MKSDVNLNFGKSPTLKKWISQKQKMSKDENDKKHETKFS